MSSSRADIRYYCNATSNSLKRHPTNHSVINDEIDESEIDNQGFQQVDRGRPRKKKPDNEMHVETLGDSSTISKTNGNQDPQQVNRTNVENNINGNYTHISKHALDYAADYHYQPIKIVCEPKLKDQREGAKFIQAFINEIKTDFFNQNISFNKPLAVDLWWLDNDRNIRIIAKTTTIAVYLSQTKRYPKEVNHIKITPYPPKHLPPQHSAIIKWVKNSVSLADLKDELESRYKSIFLVEEIIGTINERNRHVRIELTDKNEFEEMLNKGKIPIYGLLYEVDEFIPSPKLLICSKCNQPGHVKNNCRSSPFEICRRCGDDRNNKNNHKECNIQCHHCKGDHISTDYKCPFLQEYRRRLIIELRNRPELLPPDIQLFIPSKFREHGMKNKIIVNESNRYIQQEPVLPTANVRNNTNVWTHSPQQFSNNCNEHTTTNTNLNLNQEIQELNVLFQEYKKKLEEETNKIEIKYKEHIKSIKKGWILMQQQLETQAQIISSMNTAYNQTLISTCQKTLNVLSNVFHKFKTQNNTNEFDAIINYLTTHGSYINDIQSSFNKHRLSLEELLDKQHSKIIETMNTLSENTNE